MHAKAVHVTNSIECHRRYGSAAKTKLVNGVVTAVEAVPSANKKRAVTMITAIYTLGGSCRKVATLNSRSVKAGHVGSDAIDVNGFVTEIGIQNSSTATTTNATSSIAVVNNPSQMPLEPIENNTVDEIARDEMPVDALGEELVADVAQNNIAAAATETDANVQSVEWVRASIDDPPLNGMVPKRMWSVRNSVGEAFTPGVNVRLTQDVSPLEFFLLMFPPKQLTDMVRWTNLQLLRSSLKLTDASELLKFFGVLILTTKFEFTTRASLWSTMAWSKYRPAPQFGMTGMSKHRFEELFVHTRWSHQPEDRGVDCTSEEEYRWMLVDDFVTNFNEHRQNFFYPSEMICVDESMSRWYGQGGHWINHGLPQYVALDRKPENGCEIQNAACGVSGVMLRLKLVKGANLPGVEDEDFADNSNSLLHGTRVLKHLVSPWFGSHRIVCADSYFASVGAANELFRNGLRFIGVVKTATRGFPKQILTSVELQSRGDFFALKANATARTPALGAMVWMDRERRYFISTAGSFEAGTPYERTRWRQVDQTPNAAPEQVVFTIPQPKIAEIYYSTCGSIDRHNRLRQDDLCIEKKVETKDWSRRVNLSIFSMIVVDTWLVFNALRNTPQLELNQKENKNKNVN